MSRAISFAFMLLAILFAALNFHPQQVESQHENIFVEELVSAVTTYTVYSMSWDAVAILQRTEYISATLGGWANEVPEGATIISSELRVYHDVNPEWRIWYSYEGLVPVTKERFILTSGIGRDPEPYFGDYELASGEFLYSSYTYGRVNLQDKNGQIIKIILPNAEWGEYTDYDVGKYIEHMKELPHPITPVYQLALAE